MTTQTLLGNDQRPRFTNRSVEEETHQELPDDVIDLLRSSETTPAIELEYDSQDDYEGTNVLQY